MTLRERSCREGSLRWLTEPPQGLQGALSSTLWLVCAACLTVWGLSQQPLLLCLAVRGYLQLCWLELLLSCLTVRLRNPAGASQIAPIALTMSKCIGFGRQM